MKKLLKLFILFVLLICTLGIANANIIDDNYGAKAGSFELGNFVQDSSGNPFMYIKPGQATITGWTAGGPGDGVDWITGIYGADTGKFAVDLSHVTASSIYTTIPTTTGAVYDLTFAAGSYFNSATTGQVSAGSLVDQPFTTSTSDIPLAYSQFAFSFTATGPSTIILFESTGQGNVQFGPAIDSVSVELAKPAAIPEPTALLLFGVGLAGLAFIARVR
jgi:hypothetical protein